MQFANANTVKAMPNQDRNAGNAGDVLKHAVLAAVLAGVVRRQCPLVYIETHAGRGIYPFDPLELDEGRRHLLASLPRVDNSVTAPFTAALRDYLKLGAATASYPGSPLVAAHAARGLRAAVVLHDTGRGVADGLRSTLEAHCSPTWAVKVSSESALRTDAPGDFVARVTEAVAGLDTPLTVLLVDPFAYERSGTDDRLQRGNLNRAALARAIDGLRSVRSGVDGVAMVWTSQHHEELASDLRELSGRSVVTARISAVGKECRYHVVVTALGAEGSRLVEEVSKADWAASPLLAHWGFEVTFERHWR